jgi:hypothetical protein
MSKRHALEHSFEEALKTDFRWPKRGDKPFAEATESLNNALIADDDRTRLVLMTDGYKRAGDLMVRQTVEDRSSRDFLVFPILFNYRHFIELSLKYLLATFGPRVSIDPNWKDHDLGILWHSFLEMLDCYATPDPDDADSVVGDIVAEFAKIDPQSYSYRYPVDKNGKPIPISQSALDLTNLADVMAGVEGYFTGCDGYLDSISGA